MLAAPATRGRALPDPSRGALAAAAVAACALVLYLPALQYGFVFDDRSLLTAAGEPLPLGGAVPYRPLRYASYLVDWSLGGSATVYHLHNVLLHALAAALTAVVARRLGARALAAFAGALVVAFHPMAVEAAAYVAGRRDLVCVALGLASLVAWIDGRPRVALALLAGSAAAKESGLVFAVPLVAAAGLFAAPARVSRSLAAIAAVTMAAAAMTLLYGAIGPWLPVMDPATAGRTLVHYATGLAGLRVLSPDYPALVAPAVANAGSLAASALAFAAIAFAAGDGIRARRSGTGRERALVLAWLAATTCALALWGSLHEPGADRHAYLLLPALGVAAALVLSRVLAAREARAVAPVHGGRAPYEARRGPLAARVALATGAVALAATAAWASREQMQIWRSDRALWTHAVEQGDASPRAYANLARAVAADGDFALARRHLASAIAAGGDDGLAYASRAALRCGEGKRALAQRDVRRAHRAGAGGLVHDIARDCDLSLRARMHLRKRAGRPVEAFGK